MQWMARKPLPPVTRIRLGARRGWAVVSAGRPVLQQVDSGSPAGSYGGHVWLIWVGGRVSELAGVRHLSRKFITAASTFHGLHNAHGSTGNHSPN